MEVQYQARPGESVRRGSTLRNQLPPDSMVEYVDRDEYCRLLLSTRKMQQFRLGGSLTRGLRDEVTGQHYLIDEEVLLSRQDEFGRSSARQLRQLSIRVDSAVSSNEQTPPHEQRLPSA